MENPTPWSPGDDGARAAIQDKRGEAARDLLATLQRLSEVADTGIGEQSLSGWNAARGALVAAARLQMGTGAGPEISEDEDDGEPMLDNEAWMARFAPRPPGG
jgi:hypothetical protein